MSTRPALLVEAFTDEPLQGNGAAVVWLDQPATATWMQRLAGSFKQSETAFLHREATGGWQLRWFTPSCEVPLCGHATLAATLALAHWGCLQPGDTIPLASRSGALQVGLDGQRPGAAHLTLPSAGLEPLPVPQALETLLGQRIEHYWGSSLGYRVALLQPTAPLATLACPSAGLEGQDRMGLVLMQPLPNEGPALMGAPCDYQLRFFAPGLGIEEDSVTGSAHALVAPWWMEQLQRNQVRGWQPSERHGGMLCEAAGPGWVRLTGAAQLLWDGQINSSGAGCDPDDWQRAVRL
ncbi:PhzF family phenazine biosynthesis protein [Synechococcus sp. CB0101]|uniref:PhzF family phenazine biosynthesis protein n=1 Tax=Synechococcus sp. CB0101 TaxID=232348 RepID=UPI00020010F4|nr:PhzF family phenazine biosynthesis isomerase [Synechococcus sp. CB0101]QCH14002.1 PhzF family phenazine biosynthesis protein [Synechococcus sp. CB0101]